MALTAKEQQRILRYLGWAGLTVVPDATHFNSVVYDRLGNNSGKPLTIDIEKEVRGTLTRLLKIDECLDDAKCRLAASKVDRTEMNPDEIRELRAERKRWTRELSDILDIPVIKSGSGNISVVS